MLKYLLSLLLPFSDNISLSIYGDIFDVIGVYVFMVLCYIFSPFFVKSDTVLSLPIVYYFKHDIAHLHMCST